MPAMNMLNLGFMQGSQKYSSSILTWKVKQAEKISHLHLYLIYFFLAGYVYVHFSNRNAAQAVVATKHGLATHLVIYCVEILIKCTVMTHICFWFPGTAYSGLSRTQETSLGWSQNAEI